MAAVTWRSVAVSVADAASNLEGLPAAADPRRAAVLEVLSAYLALVEELDLCPWARPARRAATPPVRVVRRIVIVPPLGGVVHVLSEARALRPTQSAQ